MADQKSNSDHEGLVISYLALRKTIGILGFLFPLILIAGNIVLYKDTHIQSSISHYYHTDMRDIFVGVLCSYAFFLFTYNGYDIKDKIAGTLASLFALGVAFFPTDECNDTDCAETLTGNLHFICAVLFFLTLTYFSLFLFTKSGDAPGATRQKKKRNTVYHICGYVMLGCIILLALYFFVFKERYPGLEDFRPVFCLESLALMFFGLSWLVKGELLMKDE